MVTWLWVCGEAMHRGGSAWWSEVAYLMVAEERDTEVGGGERREKEKESSISNVTGGGPIGGV